MKRMTTSMAVFSLVGLLIATASFAQQRDGLPRQGADKLPDRLGTEAPAPPQATNPELLPVSKASVLIGSNVVNPEGESLGKIADLVIDPIDGRIKYAALSHGSILGLGGELFAVSWAALELKPDGKTFILNVSKENLENARGFDKNHWPQNDDPVFHATAREGIEQSRHADGNQPGGTISATIQEVNTTAETVTLQTMSHDSVQLQAPADMLSGLQAGDVVEVRMSGTRATEIRKKDQDQHLPPGNSQQSQ